MVVKDTMNIINDVLIRLGAAYKALISIKEIIGYGPSINDVRSQGGVSSAKKGNSSDTDVQTP